MLDEWHAEAEAEAGPSPAPPPLSPLAASSDPRDAQVRSNSLERERIFSVDVLERNAARNHGLVTCMTAANNVLLLGTSKGWLVRYDFGSDDCLEIDLNIPRWGEQSVHRVFLDPNARHALASVRSSLGGGETYYMHSKWKKARSLSRLKGALLNAVGWHKHQPSEATTKDIVLGTSGGQLFETLVDEKDKKEKYMHQLYELTDPREPICGVQMEILGSAMGVRYFVIVATPSRLYAFVGQASLEFTFSAFASPDSKPWFMEVKARLPNSELHLFGKQQRRMEQFAWLSGDGVHEGQISFNAQPGSNSTKGEAVLVAQRLLEYSKLGSDEDVAKPLSFAISDYHFLLLYSSKLKVVNRVSQEVVEEERFSGSREAGSGGLLGLCTDYLGGAFYAYSQTAIYEIAVQDESRNMWRVYLDQKEYAAALELCRTQAQRDSVYSAQAEAAFAAGDYERAASFYAKTASIAPFEEVALKFVVVGAQDALRTFLLRKLDHLGKDERSQITMVATWAAELYLDKINRLLVLDEGREAEEEPSEYERTVREFKAFLSDCKDVLDEATTVQLLGSYGREEELVYFATLKEQHETVVQYHIRNGDAHGALAVLRKPSVTSELQYKYGPQLMLLSPTDTVDAWIAASTRLNPQNLIPALVRYAGSVRPKDEPNEAIRYLEFCVRRLQNEDSAIHNLLVSLYAKQGDENALLRFLSLKASTPKTGKFDVLYDPKYALRVCLQEGKMRACVRIYGMMAMREEAVALALRVDLELAKVEANKVEDDELRKKLWLMVARHVIERESGSGGSTQEGENIRRAIAFLKETDGLLKIEDILPFFPDFTLIDDFKDAIRLSLEEYNRQIADLKEEMQETARGADSIRRDINALSERYAIVDMEMTCGLCRKLLLTGTPSRRTASRTSSAAVGVPMVPFYIFPCNHAFHADCLTAHVLQHAEMSEKERILQLKRRLALLTEDARKGGSRGDGGEGQEGAASAEKVRTELDGAVAGDCPFCGELMIRSITEPFIPAEEEPDAATWTIGGGQEGGAPP